MKSVFLVLGLVTAFSSLSSFAEEALVPAEQLAIETGDTTLAYPELVDGDAKKEPPIECQSLNARGDLFVARGWRAFYTQRRATDKCYANPSEFCRPLGCHHVVYPR